MRCEVLNKWPFHYVNNTDFLFLEVPLKAGRFIKSQGNFII
jgi:hypothetical protein